MQFKYPELLYALFLLLIPIIVHLFQLRKFKKEAFTNVAFLKEATIQTRKSSQIKKWLILCTRLLLLAAIVLAFAQPFTTNSTTYNLKNETVIYLDNSFSMQAKGNQGELLKRAIQDVISKVPENETVSIITNDNTFQNTTIKAIKNELLQLDYASTPISYQAALLKSKTFFSKQPNTVKNLVFISDFQQNNHRFSIASDSLINLHLVQLKPENTNNISIDTAFITTTTASAIQLKVLLKNSGQPIDNLPISLFNDKNLIAKTAVGINDKAETTFSLPLNQAINGKITIDDTSLQFDNSLFFNINKASKINVLTVNANDDSFLKRIFTDDEFNYTSSAENQLNYSILEQQHLVILNELNAIPNALASALKSFTNQGGQLIVIPATNIQLESYNTLLNYFGVNFGNMSSTEKRITTINYAHPLYNKGVFEKQVDNFQYPKVNSFFNTTSNTGSMVLKFEDGKPFLLEHKHAFMFTSALNTDNSGFKNSPLIVPTLYNIGKFSLKNPDLYYTIGSKNSYDVETTMQQDAVVTLVYDKINSIPQQQYYNNKVVISTQETPSVAATYAIKNKSEILKNVSYNYNRSESNLIYNTLSASKNTTISDSVSEIFDTIKSDAKVNALWKWFVIFALALLITEMGILKYFK